jgi:hypothetical protein
LKLAERLTVSDLAKLCILDNKKVRFAERRDPRPVLRGSVDTFLLWVYEVLLILLKEYGFVKNDRGTSLIGVVLISYARWEV